MVCIMWRKEVVDGLELKEARVCLFPFFFRLSGSLKLEGKDSTNTKSNQNTHNKPIIPINNSQLDILT